ncbi:MAG: hypothetical protein WCV91_00465 [Candidatus Margulisiibacteriota bacterium]
MGNYENYIKKLKGSDAGQVDGAMHARIKTKIKKQQHKARYLLVSMLVIMLLPFAFYFSNRSSIYLGADTLAEYVIQQEGSGEDAIMNYVFLD